MKWLTAHITREGPGVPKDAPPKTGLALLADVVRREWWMLLELNLLFILFALPLVTLPAAQVAASRVTALMLQDRSVYLLRDFWEAFRSRFWRATTLGAVAIAAIAAGGYATITFLQLAKTSIVFVLPLVIAASTTVFATIATIYALTLLALSERPLATILRLALLGALARPLPVLAALMAVAVLWILHIVFYPASIFMPAVLNFSFGTLILTLSVHQAATRLLTHDRGVAAAGQNAGGGAPLRAQ
jgi:uncharacterized membrane protein YesL